MPDPTPPLLPDPDARPMVSLELACRALDIGRTRGYTLVRDGQFPVPAVKVGGQYRVSTRALHQFVNGVTMPARPATIAARAARAARTASNPTGGRRIKPVAPGAGIAASGAQRGASIQARPPAGPNDRAPSR